MISGNYISNIFEKNKFNTKNFEKFVFKFAILSKFDLSISLIYNFMNEKERKSDFISCDKGRLLIDLVFKKSSIKFFLVMYKVTNTKYIFVFSFKQGDKVNFQKIMKTFFEVNKNNFILF